MSLPKPPIFEKRINPHTGLPETVVYLKWNSEEEFHRWMDAVKEELKPQVLAELQKDARKLFKDIFGKEL